VHILVWFVIALVWLTGPVANAGGDPGRPSSRAVLVLSQVNEPSDGSEIGIRDVTVWQRYSEHNVAVIAALLAQAALITWLLYELRRRNRAEVVARNITAELAQLNRIAAAGELSASIAHEVNQPLTGIVTRANAAIRWLSAETPEIERAKAALLQIVAAGHRAGEVVANIRAMFTKEAAERRPVSINTVIDTVLRIVHADLEKYQVTVKVRLNEGLPSVMGSRVQLEQVILNLVMNAIESMQSVQPRTLSVKSALNNTNEVHVAIQDTGPGVDPSNLKRVFKPLFTTKPSGMGMGLSICRSIVESHNGRIWVTSGSENGSTFEFIMPAKSQS
jgi:C4-dicarboxylate-specific signal transduction histidine kinase